MRDPVFDLHQETMNDCSSSSSLNFSLSFNTNWSRAITFGLTYIFGLQSCVMEVITLSRGGTTQGNTELTFCTQCQIFIFGYILHQWRFNVCVCNNEKGVILLLSFIRMTSRISSKSRNLVMVFWFTKVPSFTNGKCSIIPFESSEI